jgi:hypothetical protein
VATNQKAVELLIRARDETKTAIRSATDGLKKFSDAQKRTAARRDLIGGKQTELTNMVSEYKTVTAEVERLGKKMSDAKRPSKALRDEFNAQRTKAAALKAELRAGALAYGQLTTGSRGTFNAMSRLAAVSRVEAAGIASSTAALNANTAAAGRNALAKRGGGGGGGLANQITAAVSTKHDRGPLGLRPFELQQLSYQINDVFTQLASGTPATQVFAQQFGQIAQLFPKVIAGFLRSLPIIAAFTAALAPFVSELIRVNKAASALKDFDLLLTRSGEGASYTAEGLAHLAQSLDKYSGSLADAKAALTVFVGDSVAPAYLERFGKTALDVAKVLKTDVTDAAEKVSTAFTGNADAILTLDDELNFLTDSERAHIIELKKSKRDAEARTYAFEIFARKYGATAEKMKGPWSRILSDFGGAWRKFAQWINIIDFAAVNRKIDALITKVQRLTGMLPGAGEGPSIGELINERIAAEAALVTAERMTAGLGGALRTIAMARANNRLNAAKEGIASYNAGQVPTAAGGDTTLDPPLPANTDTSAADAAAARAKSQRDFVAGLAAENALRKFQITMVDQEERARLILEAIHEKELAAKEVGLKLSSEDAAEITRTVGALYDAQKAHEAIALIESARLDLATARNEIESRDDYIGRMVQAAGLYKSELDVNGNILTTISAQGQEYSDILGKLYDINDATRQRAAAEKSVSDLVSLRTTMQDRVAYLDEAGQSVQADVLRERIAELDLEIVKAADDAIALMTALGGPGAEAAILNLQSVRDSAADLGGTALISGKQINEMVASGATGAFDQFGQSLAEGKTAIQALGIAFRQFAADFLKQIAMMIIKQLILNAIGGGGKGGGGGFGGFVSGLLGKAPTKHTGGLISTRGGARSNPIPMSVFNNALRFHNGGMIGLKPDEVPIVAQRDEEMLTAKDPRHRRNGGLNSGAPPVKVVNVFDTADLLDKALGSDAGERIMMNFFQRNSGAIGAMVK